MYVCLCNGITDSQLVEAAVESSSGSGNSRFSAERVADRLGAGLGCGTCREFAVELVERAAIRSASVLLPVSGFVAQPDSQQVLPFRPRGVSDGDTFAP